jgi:hypothetical protein
MRVLHIGKYYPPFAGGMEHFLADLLPALATHEASRRRRWCTTSNRVAGAVSGRWQAIPSQGTRIGNSRSTARPVTAGCSMPRSVPHSPSGWRGPSASSNPTCCICTCPTPQPSGRWRFPPPAACRGSSTGTPMWWPPPSTAAGLAYRSVSAAGTTAARRQSGGDRHFAALSGRQRRLASWRERCHVIPLGLIPAASPIPIRRRGRGRKRYGANGFRVLAIGRLTYYKGHDVLIRAAADLPGKQPGADRGYRRHGGSD